MRAKDPVTGAEKGRKLARYDLIPVRALELLAKHYGIGSKKYADRNWEAGYPWSWSFASLLRHAFAFWRGETLDPETGSPHLIAVAWHALALTTFSLRNLGTDDRTHED